MRGIARRDTPPDAAVGAPWRRPRLLMTLAVAMLGCPGVAGGAYKQYYVSPGGRSDGNGSVARPLDLAMALSAQSPAKAGDTIWLLGGKYKGAFVSRLVGTSDRPIIVRQVPGHRATIDCRAVGQADALFSVEGEWTTFWGFEVTCSDTRRVTKVAGSAPADIRRGGVHCRGSNIRFVNLVVHDCGNGFGFWSGGEGGQIYGCLIYNNGWDGPDRGHGHGIYAQNRTGTKRLADNVIFNQFSHGIHAYGSSRAYLRGFHVEGNVCFNNGSPSRGGSAPNILVGGGCPAAGVKVLSNFTYHRDLRATSVRLGYGAVNEDVVVQDNYFAGLVNVKDWRRIELSNNTFVASEAMVGLDVPRDVSVRGYEWDANTYHFTGTDARTRTFIVRTRDRRGPMLFDDWRRATGLDGSSSYLASRPKGLQVFIRPNRYELGRANIIVYNWAGREAVELDLKDLLKIGARYEVVAAEDCFGTPAASGVFDGKAARIPLGPVRPPAPVGLPALAAPAKPVLRVFILRPAAPPH